MLLLLSLVLACSNPAGSAAASGGAGQGGSATTGGRGNVGDGCVPDEEANAEFPGFGDTTNIGLQPTACETDACLSLGFIGRVTCPEGQDEAGLQLPATDPNRCKTPAGEPVTVLVPPQDPNLPASNYVICSCRCDANAPSPCICPSTMECRELWPPRTLPNGTEVGGSYCVFPGTVP